MRRDFNYIISLDVKVGGASINQGFCEAFVDCNNDCQLMDLGFFGSPSTWTKGQLHERLDRLMADEDWCTLFPSSNVTYLPIPSSDHCALWFFT